MDESLSLVLHMNPDKPQLNFAANRVVCRMRDRQMHNERRFQNRDQQGLFPVARFGIGKYNDLAKNNKKHKKPGEDVQLREEHWECQVDC